MTGREPIDCMYLGVDRMIGCWPLGDTLVDPGPESCLETLLAALARPPRRLLLTHVHLDHAGAAGALVERFPGLEVFVHEVGAPHLADPSRLVASAERLYGDRMDELWGRVAPVPERNLRPLRGGERLDDGIGVIHTPGHADHHVAYLHEGTAFVGDVAGVRIPPAGFVLMPTPPPDIDLERWHASIALVEAQRPRRLALTHFGAVDRVAEHLANARASLDEWAERARGTDRDRFVESIRCAIATATDAEAAARYEQAAPPDQLHMGLERYWRKRAEAGATA